MAGSLEPDRVFILKPGTSTTYEGVRIEVNQAGQLAIKDQPPGECVEFKCTSGVGGNFHCIAVRKGNRVSVFSGSVVGSGMINREMVLTACR